MRKTFSWKTLTALGLLSFLFITRPTHAAGTITKISLDPAATTITADQKQVFKVIATADDGTTSDISSGSALSMDDPLGTLESMTYAAGKVGTWTIQATYQGLTATASATVTAGQIAEITINPNSDPEHTVINRPVTFKAVAYDQHNNIVPDQTFTWSVIGEIGTIDKNGVFTATKVGTGKIQAVVGTITSQVSVDVAESLLVTTSNTNSVANVNTGASTNRNANANTNANTNTVANQNTNTSTNTNTSSTTDTETKCSTLAPWLWVIILIVFLLAAAILYAFIPVVKIWPVVVVLVVAGGLAYVQRQYGCDQLSWFTWIVTLGALAISALAMRGPKPVNQ